MNRKFGKSDINLKSAQHLTTSVPTQIKTGNSFEDLPCVAIVRMLFIIVDDEVNVTKNQIDKSSI